jgi:hypothetical protein
MAQTTPDVSLGPVFNVESRGSRHSASQDPALVSHLLHHLSSWWLGSNDIKIG